MIDYAKTILSTIVDKINRLRYQAQDDSKAFKAVLQLIILDDMLEWAEQHESEQVLEKLYDLRHQFVMCSNIFNKEYSNPSTDPYINVNVPQTTDTWKRVWDSKYGIGDYIVEGSSEGAATLYPLPKSFIKVNDFIIKEIPELDK